jgi:hypothetical protein
MVKGNFLLVDQTTKKIKKIFKILSVEKCKIVYLINKSKEKNLIKNYVFNSFTLRLTLSCIYEFNKITFFYSNLKDKVECW